MYRYVCALYEAYAELFPNARIIIDRFHIVNHIDRALCKTRVHTMKKFSTSSMEYKRLKHYWKLIQKDYTKLDGVHFRRYVHFKRWKSSIDVVNESIECDIILKHTYEAYQLMLYDIKTKDYKSLKKHMKAFRGCVSPYMKVAIDTLLKNIDNIRNSIENEYSNGCIEGYTTT